MTSRQYNLGVTHPSLTVGLYIFGDEILSGKREDKHFQKTREILGSRGLALSWVHYLGDDPQRCVDALSHSFASQDVVFGCGGIGSTPDDHTRQAAAKALGRPLVLHPEARSLIAQRCEESGQPLTPERLRMGEFPEGSDIVPNPYNKIPGFSIHRHFFLPGFPVMAWPMMEWVLDTHFQHAFQSLAELDQSFMVAGVYEAAVTPLMEEIHRTFPDLKIYSLPAAPVPGDASAKRFLELGLKLSGGRATQDPSSLTRLDEAYSRLRAGALALGGEVLEERKVRR